METNYVDSSPGKFFPSVGKLDSSQHPGLGLYLGRPIMELNVFYYVLVDMEVEK